MVNLLGLSFDNDDAAAALVKDGVLVAAMREERVSRRQHDGRLPIGATDFVLAAGGLQASDLDHVVFYEKPLWRLERALLTSLATFPRGAADFVRSMGRWVAESLWVKARITRALGVPGRRVLFADHHTSHAASSFFTSPFDEAAILTVDGVGEWATATLAVGRGTNIEVLHELRFPHSLGLFLAASAAYCGYESSGGEVDLMGLAAFGRPRHLDVLRQLVRIDDDGSLWLHIERLAHSTSPTEALVAALEARLGRPRRRTADVRSTDEASDPFYGDVAASVQALTEQAMLAMAAQLHRLTGLSKLCLAGSVAQNSVANHRVLRDGPFDQLYVHAAPGDDGASAGAALWAYHQVLGHPRRPASEHAYLGAEASDRDIEALLDERGVAFQRFDDDEPLLAFTARALAAGQLVGWMRGRSEWGPHALGARSILADPRRKASSARLHGALGGPDSSGVFAPAVLEERAAEFFELTSADPLLGTRFQSLAVPVHRAAREQLEAVTRADGTAQLQTVARATNPMFHRLIECFGALTGVPVLLNTALRMRGEPLSETPAQAFDTFMHSDLDLLVLNNFVIAAGPRYRAPVISTANEPTPVIAEHTHVATEPAPSEAAPEPHFVG